MSIASFMYTGVSGLNSHSDAMSVISDNIANVNTVGYKASRANFSDVLGGVMAGQRTGAGSVIDNVQTIFNQGSLLGTGKATDLAIQGDGFFMVQDPNGTAPMYTRAGQFEIDENGFMVDLAGNRVQGFGPERDGGVLGDLLVDTAALPPVPTTGIEIDATLDAGVTASGTPFDIANPGTTSEFSTSVTVYDSLGVGHQLELYFTKTADAPSPQWEVNVTAPSTDVTPAGPDAQTLLGTGTLDFGTDGSLSANGLASVNAAWNGAAAETIALDFGTPTGGGGTGVDGITSLAGGSAATFVDQNGNGSGDLGGYQIGDDGMVTGLYTNGESRELGQIATASFRASAALSTIGDGLYAPTPDSGEPVFGRPTAGGHGRLVAGSLESSNVDLANEFVNMIAVQRGFQGNSRSITTADEMLADVVSLKR